MREMILKAVANPPKILWGPFLPTLLNLGIQFPFMFILIGIYGINPLMSMISIALGQIFCIGLGVKEPHISAMIQAFGQTNRTTVNLYKGKGKKFAP